MRVVALSNTKGAHSLIKHIPDGDVIVFSGNVTNCGFLGSLFEFNRFLGALPHEHKIVVAGNQDWCFLDSKDASMNILDNAIYLEDSSIVIDGVNFYGTPWQPFKDDWAFNIKSGLRDKLHRIPTDTDVLLTPAPPAGLPGVANGQPGCSDLAEIVSLVKPQAHIFGGSLESHGSSLVEGVTFVNATIWAPGNDALTPQVYDVEPALLKSHRNPSP